MNPYHNSGLPGNGEALPISTLPLFRWAATRITFDPAAPPTERAVRHVARRYGLPPHLARVRAEHAGFKLEACA